MKKLLSYLSLALLAGGIALSSCDKGSTIGTVVIDKGNGFVPFDSFAGPTEDYYFYGVFDGNFKMWQHNKRSRWDTITRLQGPDDEDVWADWPPYDENIYYNYCNEGAIDDCDEPNTEFYKHQMRFIRPDLPGMRIAVSLYRCLNTIDTFSNFYVEDSVDMVKVGAWPFSDIERGEWGAEVEFIDEDFGVWTTNTGSGKPEDAYFRILDLYEKPATDTLDTFALHIVEGEFAGRLFNSIGQEIVVTSSRFRSRIFARNPEGFQ